MTPNEVADQADAEALCERLRARGDADSQKAAALIEGTLEAFATLARERDRIFTVNRTFRASLHSLRDLWARVPPDVQLAVARKRAPDQE